MQLHDEATAIRQGEELDILKLREYLDVHLGKAEGEVRLHQFPSGNSNLTYLLKWGNTEYVLRRPPFGTKAKSAHDMSREFRILSRLQPHYSYCPKVILFADDPQVMGSDFYLMERLEGIIVRKDLPKEIGFGAKEMHQLCQSLMTVHLQLHQIDYEKIGLADLGKPEGYVERQVQGWSKRYQNSKTEDAPSCVEIMQWLAEKMPKDSTHSSIIHNDYKLDNVILNPQNPLEIIGVLDWEMATLGDPLMDLGSSIAYWVEANDPPSMQSFRMAPTHVEGAMKREELIAYYSENSGISIENFDFYYCFGLFRLAVIAQQIYYRFYHGQTQDQRFSMMIHGVRGLEQQARHLINNSKL